MLSYSLFFVLVSVCVVVLIEPAAASSGIPEVIAYLNGVHIPRCAGWGSTGGYTRSISCLLVAGNAIARAGVQGCVQRVTVTQDIQHQDTRGQTRLRDLLRG